MDTFFVSLIFFSDVGLFLRYLDDSLSASQMYQKEFERGEQEARMEIKVLCLGGGQVGLIMKINTPSSSHVHVRNDRI